MTGKRLTNQDKKDILERHKKGQHIRDISRDTGHSTRTILRIVKRGHLKGKKKRLGRPPKVSLRDKRRIRNLASQNAISATDIKSVTGVEITPRQIINIINESPYLTHAKMPLKPMISPDNVAHRFSWSRNMVRWSDEGLQTIWFSDEKKFRLDGPDGYHCYWHDLRKEPIYFSQSQRSQTDGIMMWGTISTQGRHICRIYGRVTGATYVEMLKKELIPNVPSISPENFTFQQDNAPRTHF